MDGNLASGREAIRSSTRSEAEIAVASFVTDPTYKIWIVTKHNATTKLAKSLSSLAKGRVIHRSANDIMTNSKNPEVNIWLVETGSQHKVTVSLLPSRSLVLPAGDLKRLFSKLESHCKSPNPVEDTEETQEVAADIPKEAEPSPSRQPKSATSDEGGKTFGNRGIIPWMREQIQDIQGFTKEAAYESLVGRAREGGYTLSSMTNFRTSFERFWVKYGDRVTLDPGLESLKVLIEQFEKTMSTEVLKSLRSIAERYEYLLLLEEERQQANLPKIEEAGQLLDRAQSLIQEARDKLTSTK